VLTRDLATRYGAAVAVSARNGDGLPALKEQLAEVLAEAAPAPSATERVDLHARP
jgi:50S ribosomal subunit-associated GTPase HflX